MKNHKASMTMADREGRFQRCRECGARRKVSVLGQGFWDKGTNCGVEEGWIQSLIRPEATTEELLQELYSQTK